MYCVSAKLNPLFPLLCFIGLAFQKSLNGISDNCKNDFQFTLLVYTQARRAIHIFWVWGHATEVTNFLFIRYEIYNDKLPMTITTKHYTTLQGRYQEEQKYHDYPLAFNTEHIKPKIQVILRQ